MPQAGCMIHLQWAKGRAGTQLGEVVKAPNLTKPCGVFRIYAMKSWLDLTYPSLFWWLGILSDPVDFQCGSSSFLAREKRRLLVFNQCLIHYSFEVTHDGSVLFGH